MKSEDILRLLNKLALGSEKVSNARIATAIFYRKELISLGINRFKSHPLQKRYSKHEEAIFLHSEIDAIKNALRTVDVDDLAKCDMYIYRVKQNQHTKAFESGLATPCEGCAGAIAAFGLRKVFHTMDNKEGFLCSLG